MTVSHRLFGMAFLVAAVAAMSGTQDAYAQSEEEYVPKAKVTSLFQGPLPGVEGKEVLIRHFDIPPKFVGGKHWHPGPVYVYVLEGELTVETEDGVQTFKAGDLYEEPTRRTMQGKNMSGGDPVKLVVFQIGDKGKPMMIKAD